MAASYLRFRAPREGLSHVLVDSGGLLGIDNAPASTEAIEVMREIGVELGTHRSRGLVAGDLARADLTVAMTRDHLDELAARFRSGSDERVLLRAWEQGSQPDPNARDLADPIGQPVEFYRRQRGLLTRCIDHLILHLRHGR